MIPSEKSFLNDQNQNESIGIIIQVYIIGNNIFLDRANSTMLLFFLLMYSTFNIGVGRAVEEITKPKNKQL